MAFRKHTLLPLDDCLYALQATIPHLTRSSLHRCYQHHGISRLPDTEGDKPAKKAFKTYPIGFFHIDIAEVQTAQGKLYLFVAIDRTSKFAFAKLAEKANRMTASAFLTALIEAVPYKIHTVLTDNGIQFTFPARYADGPTARYATHMFDIRCRENGIEHRLTKPNHPWTNGQVERMNRTLKEATVRRYHYETHDQLREHLDTRANALHIGLCPDRESHFCRPAGGGEQTQRRIGSDNVGHGDLGPYGGGGDLRGASTRARYRFRQRDRARNTAGPFPFWRAR